MWSSVWKCLRGLQCTQRHYTIDYYLKVPGAMIAAHAAWDHDGEVVGQRWIVTQLNLSWDELMVIMTVRVPNYFLIAIFPPSHAAGSVNTMSEIGYQRGGMSHIAISPTMVNTTPVIPRTMACFIGLFGARRGLPFCQRHKRLLQGKTATKLN